MQKKSMLTIGLILITFGFTLQAQTEKTENLVAVSKDGKGEVVVSGELKQWHKVTLSLNGPFSSETNKSLNPF